MNFEFRLARYKAWISRQKEALEVELDECRASLESAARHLSECGALHESLCREAENQLKTGIAADQIRVNQFLFQQSRQRMEQAREVVRQREQQMRLLTEQWLKLYRRNEMLHRLFERQKQNYRHAVQRNEQKLHDDWSMMKGGEQQWIRR